MGLLVWSGRQPQRVKKKKRSGKFFCTSIFSSSTNIRYLVLVFLIRLLSPITTSLACVLLSPHSHSHVSPTGDGCASLSSIFKFSPLLLSNAQLHLWYIPVCHVLDCGLSYSFFDLIESLIHLCTPCSLISNSHPLACSTAYIYLISWHVLVPHLFWTVVLSWYLYYNRRIFIFYFLCILL